MGTHNVQTKSRVVVDLGPSTIILLSEIILIVLKILGYITFSWEIVLSPILMVIVGSALILFITLARLIKDNLF